MGTPTWVTSLLARFASRPSQPLVLGVVLSVVTTLLGATPLGRYLDESLWIQPAQALRRALGLNPKPHESVRFILMEDRALARLKRVPTFEEWITVAQRLERLGFDRVLLLGLHTPQALVMGRSAPTLIHGVADIKDGSNLRAIKTSELPPSLFVAAKGIGATLPQSEFVIGASALASAGGVGLSNLPSSSAMPVGVAVGDDSLLPNIGLRVAKTLTWEAGELVADGFRVPVSTGERLLVDYLDYRDVQARSIAASALLARADGSLSDQAQEKLKGGRVAIIAPDAFTGTRFVETGLGLMPSFMASASIANSVLTRRTLVMPAPPAAWLVALSALLLIAAIARRRHGVALTSISLLTLLVTSLGLFLRLGVVLPLASMVAVNIAASIVALADWALLAFARQIAVERDLELGRTVQALMFPKARAVETEGWERRVSFRPYGAMSGDWFQVYESPEGTRERVSVVAIGDVVGKGPSAALCTAMIAAVWSSLSDDWDHGAVDPRVAVTRLARIIERTFKGTQNSTLSLAVLDRDKLQLVSMGAPHWYSVDAGGKVDRHLAARRDPLGLGELNTDVPVITLPIESIRGRIFTAFTDGVVDGAPARHRFEKEIMRRVEATRAEASFEVVEASLKAAGEGSTQPDDATIVMLRCA